jgi:predicted permease
MDFERWLYIIRLRLRSLFRGARVERDLEDELRFHVERLTQRGTADGLTPAQSRLAALRAMGGLEQRKEECRDLRRVRFFEDCAHDLRYAARMLQRNPVFAGVAIVSLALGIGANTAIFSVVDALTLRALPVREPRQLVAFTVVAPQRESINFSYPAYLALRDRLPMFEGIVAAAQPLDRYNIGLGGAGVDSRQAFVAPVSGNYFSVLGVGAAAGRTLSSGDDRPEAEPVTVLSYGYWQSRFGLAGDVVGRQLTLNGSTFTIVGVAPRGFTGEQTGRATDLWFPMAMEPLVIPEAADYLTNTNVTWLRIIARLAPGSPLQQASAAADAAWQQAASAGSPNTANAAARERLELAPFVRGFEPYRNMFGQPLTIVMIIVSLVLLIACVNVANLLLVRSAAREHEVALRLSLGASRGRIVRQLITENLLLAVPAGVLGMLIGVWLGAGAPNAMATDALFGSVRLDVRLDRRILGFSAAVSFLSLMIFGLAPAISASRPSLTPGLKKGGAQSGAVLSGRMLVIAQVALSIVLLVGAGLFVRTLRNLQIQDRGLDSGNVLLVWTRHGQTGLGRTAALSALYARACDRLLVLPGVRSVSYAGMSLFARRVGTSAISIESQPEASNAAAWNYVAPRFLETLGIPLLAGRDFTPQDNLPASARVAIVNDTMARQFFPNANPIGRHFGFSPTAPQWEIIGVMGTAHLQSLRGETGPEFYIPYREGSNISGLIWLAIRANGDPADLAAQVRRELMVLDRNLAILKIEPLPDALDHAMGQERLLAALSGSFGAFALALTCLGLYGVISFTTARRTSEIGVRIALGATRTRVASMVLKESFIVAAIGVVIGVPAALLAARTISSGLFGVSPDDPFTIAAAVAAMLLVACAAALVPARRAARIDPIQALRCE